jgi:hypothetical protein
MGRIGAYQRVRLHSTSTVAVAGHAAEGVMHALAELMDNATSFSPPAAEVHVYVEEVYTGVVITIEDGGLVMSDVALERAQKAVSAAPLDLTTLSGTRLGLAVVGCLARKHGLTISFRPSSRGGTGVVMMIPQELITQSREPSRAPGGAVAETQTGGQRPAPEEPRVPAQGSRRPAPAPAPAPVPAPAPAPEPAPVPVRPPAPAAPAEARRGDPRSDRDRKHDRDSGEHAYSGAEYGESGLPKRRRGQTLAAAPDPAAPESDGQRPAQQPARSPEDSGERFLAFRRTVQGTAAPTTAPGSGAPRFPEGFGTVGGVDPWADNTRDTTGQNTGTAYDTATGAHALSPTRPEGFGTSGAVVPWSDDHHGTSESDSE